MSAPPVSQSESAGVSVSAGVANEPVTIQLTKPDQTTDTLSLTTTVDPTTGSVTASGTYTATQVGTFTGVANIPAEFGFGAATSAPATFTVAAAPTPRTISLTFSP